MSFRADPGGIKLHRDHFSTLCVVLMRKGKVKLGCPWWFADPLQHAFMWWLSWQLLRMTKSWLLLPLS